MDGAIASAVVLPDEPQPPPKRRQSSVSEESAKRPRLEDDVGTIERRDTNTDANPTALPKRERGRERRLFGAALGALSQNPSTTAAQKRRSEIEKRQLAQRRVEDEESQQRKAERIARRKEQRWKEQRRFEKESLRLRHDNLLHTAHFLRTETSPQLYYKPWETTDEEEARIREQIADARKTIERESEEYEARKEQEADRQRRPSPRSENTGHDPTNSEPGKEQLVKADLLTSATNGNTNGSHISPKDQDMAGDHTADPDDEAVRTNDATANVLDQEHETTADDPSEDHHDENGEDVIEEAAEDTVIY